MSEIIEAMPLTRFDELRDASGVIRPQWRSFAKMLTGLAPEDYARRRAGRIGLCAGEPARGEPELPRLVCANAGGAARLLLQCLSGKHSGPGRFAPRPRRAADAGPL